MGHACDAYTEDGMGTLLSKKDPVCVLYSYLATRPSTPRGWEYV